MKNRCFNAMFLIAACAFVTGATAQNVYRCGSSYGQKPCADGVIVDVQDARTTDQRADSEAQIRKETAAVRALEKTQAQEEARLRTETAKTAKSQAAKAAAKPKSTASEPDHVDAASPAPKRGKAHHAKKKEPEYFTARSPAVKPERPASASK